MSSAKKAPPIYYFLNDKLQKLKEQQLSLEHRLTVDADMAAYRELNLVNYHILCTENRIAEKFKDPLGDSEYALMTSNKTYTGVR